MRLDPETWHVQEKDGLRLVIPSHGAAVANAPWTTETVWYRSRVETLEGAVVSQGFSKFFNLDSGPDWAKITFADIAQACEKSDVYATVKIDGSLLIRAVYRGEVVLRTRGSFSYTHCANAYEVEEFRKKYPRFFDPLLFPNCSLLSEWTSPTNQIVLKYPEPDITLVGIVNYDSENRPSYAKVRQLDAVGKYLNVPVVQHFLLNTAGWERLYAALDSDHSIEGYVIRLHNEQRLVKVKAAPYLTKHALKSNLSTEKLVELYFQKGRPSYGDFCKEFANTFDEEVCMWAMPAISALYDGVKKLDAISIHIWKKVEERKGWTRKEAAIAGQAEYGYTKKFGYYMNCWLGLPPENSRTLLKGLLLQNTKQMELSFARSKTDDDEEG